MLAIIIIITFYVICNVYYYLILITALYEWVCWFLYFIDTSWSSERLILVPKATLLERERQGF